MERPWLEAELAAGRSIESLAREVGIAPSTVAYWANKHGLVSAHAARHAARGAIERAALTALVDAGLSTRAIAAELGRSQATVRHWLSRHGLATERVAVPPDVMQIERTCRRHGRTSFVRYSAGDSFRCELCRKERVVARRRRVKAILVEEAGGRCRLCGYDRYAGALQFHHVDPAVKSFGLARQGVARSLVRSRAEAAKCVLLCANCHAEVEAGVAELPCGPAAAAAAPSRVTQSVGLDAG
jgi:transposase-like protein